MIQAIIRRLTSPKPTDRPSSQNETAMLTLVERLQREADEYRDTYMVRGVTIREMWDQCNQYFMGDQHNTAPPAGILQPTINVTQNANITNVSMATEQEPRVNITARDTGQQDVYYFGPKAVRRIARLIDTGQLKEEVEQDEEAAEGEPPAPPSAAPATLDTLSPSATDQAAGSIDAGDGDEDQDEATGQPPPAAPPVPAGDVPPGPGTPEAANLATVQPPPAPAKPPTPRYFIRLNVGDQELVLEDREYLGKAPIDEDTYELLTKPAVDAATGQPVPPLFQEEDFVSVNDAVCAEYVKSIYEAMWDSAHVAGQAKYEENELYKTVYGTQPMGYHWDSAAGTFQVFNPHFASVWVDPTNTLLEHARYLIWVYPFELDRLLAEMPHLEDDLKRAAQEGQLHDPTAGIALPRFMELTDYQTQQVLIKCVWIRNHPYPLTEAEAIDQGHVVKAFENGRQLYFLADADGEPIRSEATMPGTANWPRRLGVRQIRVLPQIARLIDDRECPHLDMPWAINVNIPLLHGPLGVGEPFRLKDPQDMVNHMAGVIATNLKYYCYPQEYWPNELLQFLEAKGVAVHSHPGRQIGIPKDEWEQYFGNNNRDGFAEPPPELPEWMVEQIRLWLDLHDNLAGRPDVIQGRPPSDNTSGVAIAQLQTAVRGVVAFKAKSSERMLERICRLAIHDIVHRLNERQAMALVGKWPIQVLREIRRRCRAMEFRVRVEVVAGRGRDRQAEQDKALLMHEKGLIGGRDALERLDDPDPKRTFERKLEEDSGEVLRELGYGQQAVATPGAQVPGGPPAPGGPAQPQLPTNLAPPPPPAPVMPGR